jgi:molecular chaperone GrpE
MNDRREKDTPTPGPATNGDPAQARPPRHGGTRAEERIAALDTSGAAVAARMEELEAALAAAEQRADVAEAGWQRERADFTNYRRRSEQEAIERAGRAADDLLLRVVAIADDFDLAIEHVPADAKGSPWVEGVSAIDRKLRLLLESVGVSAMRTLGQPFDPREHQAISYEETADVADGTVLRELQRGYRVGDRVLRPALVAVARNDDDTHTTSAATPDQEDS